MATGLFALFDDIAALAKLAASSLDDIGAAASKASVKAAGVVVDDAAVTPRYVHGFTADRELPAIKRIAKGSLRNKAIILPIIMLLSEFLPWLLTPLLMLGGLYLSFEGAEKLYEKITHNEHGDDAPAATRGADAEASMVSGAIRTDFILSTEIMVIALNEVTDQAFVSRLFILIIVAIVITVIVYGAVALIVKMDDAGLYMAEKKSPTSQRIGRGLVAGMPKLLKVLSIVGVAAMLWVGGHILLVGVDDLGWHAPYEFVHHMEERVHHVGGIGGVLAWFVNTLASAIIGVIVGGLIMAILHRVKPHKTADEHHS